MAVSQSAFAFPAIYFSIYELYAYILVINIIIPIGACHVILIIIINVLLLLSRNFNVYSLNTWFLIITFSPYLTF